MLALWGEKPETAGQLRRLLSTWSPLLQRPAMLGVVRAASKPPLRDPLWRGVGWQDICHLLQLNCRILTSSSHTSDMVTHPQPSLKTHYPPAAVKLGTHLETPAAGIRAAPG